MKFYSYVHFHYAAAVYYVWPQQDKSETRSVYVSFMHWALRSNHQDNYSDRFCPSQVASQVPGNFRQPVSDPVVVSCHLSTFSLSVEMHYLCGICDYQLVPYNTFQRTGISFTRSEKFITPPGATLIYSLPISYISHFLYALTLSVIWYSLTASLNSYLRQGSTTLVYWPTITSSYKNIEL